MRASTAKLGATALVSAKMTVDNAKILDVVAFMIRSSFLGSGDEISLPNRRKSEGPPI
jgi:hypothetical protein